MRDEMKNAGDSKLIDGKVILPQQVLDDMRLHPDNYVEIYNYSDVGQIEFSGISYIDDDSSIFIPDEIIAKLGNRDTCEFLVGKDGEMAIIRALADEKLDEVSSRQRHLTKGTLTSRPPPVEMRIYKHICDVVRYGSSGNYVPLGDTCALCGNALKGKKQFPYAPKQPRKCVRCGQEVRSNYCGNCGLKLVRKESVRKCRYCGGKLDYIEKYGRFYCYKCGRYERALKPGVKQATCPDCGKELSYVKKHDHWYCFECKGYRTPLESTPPDRMKTCPDCKGNLTYAEQHDKFYCRKCGGYKDTGEKKPLDEGKPASEKKPAPDGRQDKARPPEQKPVPQKPAGQKPPVQKPTAQPPAGQKQVPQKPADKKLDIKKSIGKIPDKKTEIKKTDAKKQPPRKPVEEEDAVEEPNEEDEERKDESTAPPPEDEDAGPQEEAPEDEAAENEASRDAGEDEDEG